MKKSLLFTKIILLTAYYSFSQLPVSTTAQNKNVVLEEFTGIRCVFCPDGHKRAQAIKTANPGRVVLLNIHTGSFASPTSGQPNYTTSFGAAIANQTGLTGYPSGTVNRTIFSGSKTASGRGDWAANSTTILGQGSYSNIALEGSIDILTRLLTVNTEVYITGTAPSSLKLNIALLQNNVAGPQTGASANPTQINSNGDYIHGHMLRHLITGQWGDTITTTSTGTTISRSYTYTLPNNINGVPLILGDLEIAGFIAEGNQTIVTGANGPISFVAPPGVSIVDLSSSNATTIPTNFCASNVTPTVSVTNNSMATVDTFQVSYKLNGGPSITQAVYNSIAPSATATVSFPTISLPIGVNNFTFDCNVNNANSLMEIATANNNSSSSEIIRVTNLGITGAIAEQFEGYAFNTPAPNNAFAINPNDISASIVKSSDFGSSPPPPLGGFGNSNGAFWWRFYEIENGKSSLLFDKLSFLGRTNSRIVFDMAYAQYESTSKDTLEVEISTDCGSTWNSVYSKSGQTLSTVSPTDDEFIPSANDWRKDTIDLSAYDGQSTILIKFTGISNFGNNLFIDNLRIVDNLTASIHENGTKAKLDLFPNPSNGLVYLQYNSDFKEKTTTISVTNSLGAYVYREITSNNNSFKKTLDLSNLEKGIYFVKVSSNSNTTIKKLVLQ